MNKSMNSTKGSTNDLKDIQLDPRKIKLGLAIILMILVLISLIGQYLRFYTNYDEAFGLIPLFNMARALSVPKIFDVLLLFLAAALFALIAVIKYKKNDIFRKHWSALAFTFIFLSLNEPSGVYKLVFTPIRDMLREILPGVTIFSWHLTLILITAVLLCFYRKFFLSLPSQIKTLIVVSAALYMAGFAAQKLISGVYLDYYDTSSFAYSLLRTIAKSLEIASVISLIYTLVVYLQKNFPKISLKFEKN